MDPSETRPTDAERASNLASSSVETVGVAETAGQRFSRKAHRIRLYLSAFLTVALLAFLVTLAASNTIHIKVSWVFGSSSVSLVWLVLSAAVISWLLGIVTGITVHRRTRRPRGLKSVSPRDQARP